LHALIASQLHPHFEAPGSRLKVLCIRFQSCCVLLQCDLACAQPHWGGCVYPDGTPQGPPCVTQHTTQARPGKPRSTNTCTPDFPDRSRWDPSCLSFVLVSLESAPSLQRHCLSSDHAHVVPIVAVRFLDVSLRLRYAPRHQRWGDNPSTHGSTGWSSLSSARSEAELLQVQGPLQGCSVNGCCHSTSRTALRAPDWSRRPLRASCNHKNISCQHSEQPARTVLQVKRLETREFLGTGRTTVEFGQRTHRSRRQST
jgi:hypothetical protein